MEFIWELFLKNGFTADKLEVIKHIYLVILLLPIVISIVGLMRYVIGLRTLNLYAPIVLTFIFFEFSYKADGTNDLGRGLVYGLILFFLVFFTSSGLYLLLKKFRMHYVPKLSLVLTAVSISVIILIFICAYFNLNGLINISPFALVMLILVSEGFMAILAKKNIDYSIKISFETLITVVISYFFISWVELQKLVIDNPLIIILVIIVNMFVGRYLGLRLTEYWRFKSILFKSNPENNDKSLSNTTKQEKGSGEK